MSQSQPHKQRVLIVDDNIDASVTLGNALSLFGYDVRVAYDSATALKQADAFAPQVAILDIKMPDMDGYELARRLRARPGLGKLNLVALTGQIEEVDRLHEKEAGFKAYLLKPVDLRKAVEVLEKAG